LIDEKQAKVRAVVWRRHDIPGHEACRILPSDKGWTIEGVAVAVYDGQPCQLKYDIACDRQWLTRSAAVMGWIGERLISATVIRDVMGQWQINGHDVEAVVGCQDIDLNFSPSTNLLPIRRLDLAIGARAEVRAAWLRFPSFALEPLEQSYTRLGAEQYRYESAVGQFVAELSVDDTGLVINYGQIWSREAAA